MCEMYSSCSKHMHMKDKMKVHITTLIHAHFNLTLCTSFKKRNNLPLVTTLHPFGYLAADSLQALGK